MVDVTVRGAGIFGLSIAWACLGQGASVRVVDPGGVGAGSSGGLVGALAPHTPDQWNAKKQFQFDSLIAAEPFWDGVAAASGLSPGYARTGRVQPLLNERGVELARARRAEAERNWQGRATWEVIELAECKDWQAVSPTGLAVFDTLSARLHPRQACAALAAAIEARGGSIEREGDSEGVTVWAAGWRGLLEMSDAFGKVIGNGVKGQSATLRYAAPNTAQLFADGLHIIPHGDGTVAVGSTSEREFTDPDSTDEQTDALIDKARRLAPELADAPVVERWAGVRPRAVSRAPILGGWPGRKGHFVANGGFKIGFGMAPGIAAVMADLVLGGPDRVPSAFRFDP